MQQLIFNMPEALNRINDLDLLKELLIEFSKSDKLESRIFANALAEKNYAEIESLSHSIKGVSGNLSLDGIYKASTKLNDSIKAGNISVLKELILDLMSEIGAFKAWLPGFLKGDSGL